MLFKKRFLILIKKGEVCIAFRKWTRPSVSESGTLLTPVGQLRIKSLQLVNYGQIADHEIIKAGYNSREELDNELAFKDSGDIYKIEFELEVADPRIELRENTKFSDEEMDQIIEKLKRLDARGKVMDWTYKVLDIVDSEPGNYAIEYSSKLGYEKEWFKLNIRKLKNLGLTVSLTNGYEISPRGKVVLKELKKRIKYKVVMDPKFEAGINIAIKIPKSKYEKTVAFYRDILKLEVNEKTIDNPTVSRTHEVKFGNNVIWLDCVGNYTHSETWLQLTVPDVEKATNYLESKGVKTCDELEELPKNMHWIQDPAGTVFNLQKTS